MLAPRALGGTAGLGKIKRSSSDRPANGGSARVGPSGLTGAEDGLAFEALPGRRFDRSTRHVHPNGDVAQCAQRSSVGAGRWQQCHSELDAAGRGPGTRRGERFCPSPWFSGQRNLDDRPGCLEPLSIVGPTGGCNDRRPAAGHECRRGEHVVSDRLAHHRRNEHNATTRPACRNNLQAARMSAQDRGVDTVAASTCAVAAASPLVRSPAPPLSSRLAATMT